MNTLPNINFSRARKSHHLQLQDLAHILEIDSGNLSRFEAGLYPNPKALLGYQSIFNLSMNLLIRQVFDNGYQDLIYRCFQLVEKIKEESKTAKNRLRMEGLNAVITRLTDLQEAYENENR